MTPGATLRQSPRMRWRPSSRRRTGTASAFHHGKWHGKEAELFVREVGMTPMEAILANTRHNAGLLGLQDEVGVIAAGKLADIVVWNSNPLADITVLQRPDEISAV